MRISIKRDAVASLYTRSLNRSLLPTVLGCLALLSAPASAQSPDRATSQRPPDDLKAFAAKVIELTNAERKKEGLALLRTRAELVVAAMAHARDMAEKDYF